jgi:hypothetical protein
MPRGGKRPHSGRKADPARDSKLGAVKAQKLLADLKAEAALKNAFETCKDARLIAYIFFKLFELGYGKAAENVEITGKDGGPIHAVVHTIRFGNGDRDK